MNNLICFDGKFVDGQSRIVGADTSGLKYGDGLFETMKVEHEKIRLEALHFTRLFEGMHFLEFSVPDYFTEEYLRTHIIGLCRRSEAAGPLRVRLTVFRDHPFNGDESGDNLHFIIQCFPLDPAYHYFNGDGLTIDIYPHVKKSTDTLSALKSNNYLPYILAARYARKKGINDCLVTNVYNRIADSSIANVFCISNGLIHTPPLTEGCVNGVMRKFLLSALPRHNWKVAEKNLTAEDLDKASEVFLTNALFGLRWVGKFRNTAYTNLVSRQIYERIISTI